MNNNSDSHSLNVFMKIINSHLAAIFLRLCRLFVPFIVLNLPSVLRSLASLVPLTLLLIIYFITACYQKEYCVWLVIASRPELLIKEMTGEAQINK